MIATDMNAHSSRSHTIFQVVIERKPLDTGIGADTKIIRSKINLVDLAGSEKWKPHQLNRFSEKRIQEMTSINQSLSNLGNCVRALLEKRRQHIPYRNSKLTRLLQDSLGGNTKTAFVVTMSPSSDALDETQSTVQFAERAKKVVVHAMVNETLDDASILRRYEHQIARLKAMLKKSQLQQQTPSLGGTPADSKELEELRRENLFLMNQLKDTRKQLHVSQEETRAIRKVMRTENDEFSAERASLEAQRNALQKRTWQNVLDISNYHNKITRTKKKKNRYARCDSDRGETEGTDGVVEKVSPVVKILTGNGERRKRSSIVGFERKTQSSRMVRVDAI